MCKLLSANLSRLWKENVFRLAFAFLSIESAVFGCMSFSTAMKNTQFYVEDMMFNMLPLMSFVIAIVISMHLGTEFDEHTMRNKMIVGHERAQIYFAEFITCSIASLVLLAVMLLVSTVSGWLLFHEFKSGWIEISFLLLCCLLMESVISAMMVGICMNVRSKAASIVVSVVFLLAILLLASFCINALAEPQTTYSYVEITMDGVQFGEQIENSAYIDGIQRTIYELIADILPTGQTIQLNNLEYTRAARWPLFSVIMLAIATIAGYMPFRKRDIQ